MHATNQYMQPGYEGLLNNDVLTIPEILKETGYHTYMTGKWHLGEGEGRRPHSRGFERSFSFLGGGASHFRDQQPLSAFEQSHLNIRRTEIQFQIFPTTSTPPTITQTKVLSKDNKVQIVLPNRNLAEPNA